MQSRSGAPSTKGPREAATEPHLREMDGHLVFPLSMRRVVGGGWPSLRCVS